MDLMYSAFPNSDKLPTLTTSTAGTRKSRFWSNTTFKGSSPNNPRTLTDCFDEPLTDKPTGLLPAKLRSKAISPKSCDSLELLVEKSKCNNHNDTSPPERLLSAKYNLLKPCLIPLEPNDSTRIPDELLTTDTSLNSRFIFLPSLRSMKGLAK